MVQWLRIFLDCASISKGFTFFGTHKPPGFGGGLLI